MGGVSVAAVRLAAPFGTLAACTTQAPVEASPQKKASVSTDRGALTATLIVHAKQAVRPVTPLVLGNNIDWTHSGQGFYEERSQRVKKGFLELADRLAPTALRYPGGTNSDFYNWRNGLGPYPQRKPTKTMEGNQEVISIGTDEFLALCKRWSSEPLITVNLATGTAEEAAEWVRYTNRRGSDLPRVRFWEIGNEPYLKAHLAEAAMTPAEFARRANLFIRAMKAVDPSIRVGLPLRNDTLGGVEATPFKGFNDIVLKAVTEPFEFATLHSSYFPVTFEKKETEEELFLATMAATRVMQEDMETTRVALRKSGRSVPLAVTEYNVLYSLDILRWGLASLVMSKTDRYIESVAGALYTADALRVFSTTDDLLMANFWSLVGNWWYGAIGHDGRPRPQFFVLEAYRDLARGQLLATELAGPVMATPRAGFVPAQKDIPVVAAHAVSEKGVIRVAIVNRHPRQQALVRLAIKGITRARVEVRELTGEHFFSRAVAWSARTLELRDASADLPLARHAFAVVTVRPT